MCEFSDTKATSYIKYTSYNTPLFWSSLDLLNTNHRAQQTGLCNGSIKYSEVFGWKSGGQSERQIPGGTVSADNRCQLQHAAILVDPDKDKAIRIT